MKRPGFETRLTLLSLAGGAPAVLVAGVLVLNSGLPFDLRLLLVAIVLGSWLGFGLGLKGRLGYQFNTLSNLLEALREEDYSMRGRRSREPGPFGDVFREVNTLSRTLREQRSRAQEATALLRKVLAEIDIAVFAFGASGQLMLANRAGKQLLDLDASSDTSPRALGLEELLAEDGRRTVTRRFPGGIGRWDVWTGSFREAGEPHSLLVISDLSRTLREEERRAWQRLVRVIGHELNNSLAPIKSTAATLQRRLADGAAVETLREDIDTSLGIIASRADALGRFMAGYTMLARLPAPNRRPVQLRPLVQRAASIDMRTPVAVDGADICVVVDPDQLEQLIINLVKNAVDAAGADGRVCVRWSTHGGRLQLEVLDSGPGLGDTDNLFVPFFTTKPQGIGIGLVLCRQIAEAHEGSLSLDNREDERGCVARLELPMNATGKKRPTPAGPAARRGVGV